MVDTPGTTHKQSLTLTISEQSTMSISKNIGKTSLTLAICAAAGMSAGVAQAADNPFGLTDLSSGYMVSEGGKMMDGKCGGNMAKDAGKKMMDGKCGGNMAKDTGKKMMDGKCGGNMAKDTAKKMDGKCGGNMAKDAAKKMDGKCGAGKCGAGMKK